MTNRPRAGVRDCAIAFADSLSRFRPIRAPRLIGIRFRGSLGRLVAGKGEAGWGVTVAQKNPTPAKGGVGMGQALNGQQIERAGLQIVTGAEEDRLETRLLTGATTRDPDRAGVIDIFRYGVEGVPTGRAIDSGTTPKE